MEFMTFYPTTTPHTPHTHKNTHAFAHAHRVAGVRTCIRVRLTRARHAAPFRGAPALLPAGGAPLRSHGRIVGLEDVNHRLHTSWSILPRHHASSASNHFIGGTSGDGSALACIFCAFSHAPPRTPPPPTPPSPQRAAPRRDARRLRHRCTFHCLHTAFARRGACAVPFWRTSCATLLCWRHRLLLLRPCLPLCLPPICLDARHTCSTIWLLLRTRAFAFLLPQRRHAAPACCA